MHVSIVHRLQDFTPITRDDLISVQRQPWFNILVEQYAKTHRLSSYARLTDDTLLTGDRVVLVLEALTVVQRIPKVHFGVVAICAGTLPHAFYYPSAPVHSKITVWLVVETRFDHSEFYAIDPSGGQHQHQPGQDKEAEEAGSEDEEADGNDGEEQPRDTAARVIAQQVPLPAGLTATDILINYKDRLQYNNVLKVALFYSNQKIADECMADQQKLQQSSGVVKRINTALTWIEREFEISPGAFRAVFDRERKANGITVRGKGDAVDDHVIAVNDQGWGTSSPG